MWLRDHAPASWARATGFLVAKDYLTLRLTGRRCTDPSDAAGTNAWDQVAGDVVGRDARRRRGRARRPLPGGRALGHRGRRSAAEAAASDCDLRAARPSSSGEGTAPARRSAPGSSPGDVARQRHASAHRPGSPSPRSEPLRDPQRRVVTFDHVIPGHYAPLGAMQAAGAAARLGGHHAGRHATGRPWPRSSRPPARSRPPPRVSSSCPTCSASGRRSGTRTCAARSWGWRATTGRRTSCARPRGRRLQPLRHVPGALEIGGPIEAIDAIGGGARSDVWLRIMADTWGVPVRRRTIVDEANSLGAAVVGGIAVGLIDDWAAAARCPRSRPPSSPTRRATSGSSRRRSARARFEDAYRRPRGRGSADAWESYPVDRPPSLTAGARPAPAPSRGGERVKRLVPGLVIGALDPRLVGGVRAGRHAGGRAGARPDRLWRQRRSARHERPQRGDRASTRAWMPTTAGPSRRPSSATRTRSSTSASHGRPARHRHPGRRGRRHLPQHHEHPASATPQWGDFGPTIFYDGQGMMVRADARRDQPGGPRRRHDLRDLGHHDRAQPGRPDGASSGVEYDARRVGRDRHRLRARTRRAAATRSPPTAPSSWVGAPPSRTLTTTSSSTSSCRRSRSRPSSPPATTSGPTSCAGS